MENASKALIIAGAILLSILIIALGMGVYTNANKTVGKSNMSAEEVNTFNSAFEIFEGEQKGSNVRSLINKINASNTAEGNTGDSRSIEILTTANANLSMPSGDTKVVSTAGAIKTNATYHVQFFYSATSGIIEQVLISTKSN